VLCTTEYSLNLHSTTDSKLLPCEYVDYDLANAPAPQLQLDACQEAFLDFVALDFEIKYTDGYAPQAACRQVITATYIFTNAACQSPESAVECELSTLEYVRTFLNDRGCTERKCPDVEDIKYDALA
jgi:hypothetical protein